MLNPVLLSKKLGFIFHPNFCLAGYRSSIAGTPLIYAAISLFILAADGVLCYQVIVSQVSIPRLRTHVYELAGKIGEHNVFHPEVRQAAEAYVSDGWQRKAMSFASRFTSFRLHGFKAFMITDTAGYRYPCYHTADNTPDRLEYELFTAVTNGLFLMLRRVTRPSVARGNRGAAKCLRTWFGV